MVIRGDDVGAAQAGELRAVRRQPEEAESVIISVADPLNLVGILLPGPLLSPFSSKVIAYRAGLPIAMSDLGAVLSQLRRLTSAPPATAP